MVETKEIKTKLEGILQKLENVEEMSVELERLDKEIEKVESLIKRDYEQIQKLKARMKKRNQKIRKLRSERDKVRSDIKEIEKIVKALGLIEKSNAKKTTKKIQKFVVVPQKGSDKIAKKIEFRSFSKAAHFLGAVKDVPNPSAFLKVKDVDGLVKAFKANFPYGSVREKKTVMYFYV